MSIEAGIVGRFRTPGPPAPQPVDRELALARLVDEIRSERANGRGIVLAVRGGQPPLVAIATAADRADQLPREEATEATAIEAVLHLRQRAEGETAEQHQCNALHRGLATLWPPRPPSSARSRTRSVGHP